MAAHRRFDSEILALTPQSPESADRAFRLQLPAVSDVLRDGLMNIKALLALLVFTSIAFAQTPPPKPPLGSAPGAKRSGKTFVEVYLQENFKGRAIRLEVPCELNNDVRLKEVGIPNDAIMSMKIPDGVTVTLYAASGYAGASQTFTGKAATLGDLKGQASSLKAEVKK